jgi:hypothetical protein
MRLQLITPSILAKQAMEPGRAPANTLKRGLRSARPTSTLCGSLGQVYWQTRMAAWLALVLGGMP